MPSIRHLVAGVASAAMVGGMILLSAAPAAATSPSCPSDAPATGMVGGTVAVGQTDWWYHTGSGQRTFALWPQNGDADLRLYASDCTTLLCFSDAGGTDPEVCSVSEPGTVYIGVVGSSSSTGSVNYTMSAPSFGVNPSGLKSGDCGGGTPIAEGYAAGNFVRVRSVKPSANTTWVCVRADGPAVHNGGKLVVTGPGATIPPLPRTDTNSNACSTTPGNTVAGPHPLLNGAIGDPGDPSYLPFLLDSYAQGGDAWLCAQLGTFKVRAVVSTGASVQVPSIDFEPDSPGGYPPPVPPVIGTPSGTCQAASPYGVTRYADLNAEGVRTFLYTWQASPSVLKICVRTSGLLTVGGMLTVDTTNLVGGLPSVTTGSDMTGCTIGVASLGSPVSLEVRRSGTSLPVSACVRLGATTVRVTAGTGNGQPPATVTWTPDPGTP